MPCGIGRFFIGFEWIYAPSRESLWRRSSDMFTMSDVKMRVGLGNLFVIMLLKDVLPPEESARAETIINTLVFIRCPLLSELEF